MQQHIFHCLDKRDQPWAAASHLCPKASQEDHHPCRPDQYWCQRHYDIEKSMAARLNHPTYTGSTSRYWRSLWQLSQLTPCYFWGTRGWHCYHQDIYRYSPLWKGHSVTMGSENRNQFLIWAVDECDTLKLTWTSNTLIWEKQWPLPAEKPATLEQLVQEQLDKEHLALTTSPWNTPVFVIRKSNSGK